LERAPAAKGLALDLSAAAARRAARCHPRAAAATADVWSPLPLRDKSESHALVVFAPRARGELVRVLTPKGRVTVVTPHQGHLAELREALPMLGIEPGKPERLDAAMAPLALRSRDRLAYTVTLDVPDVVRLVMMGPNAFHLGPGEARAGAERLLAPVEVSVGVDVSVYTR
jgi:23S rRNA (guanine745-N1)-methyltransferase